MCLKKGPRVQHFFKGVSGAATAGFGDSSSSRRRSKAPPVYPSGLTCACGAGLPRAGARAACPCGGMLAHSLISRSGRASVWPAGPGGLTRLSVPCRHIGVACLCDELQSGAGSCRRARSWGMARLRTLTIHHGRHTFISHALAGGRTLAEVREAAGHSSLLTTSVYLHVAVDDDGEVGRLFAFRGQGADSGRVPRLLFVGDRNRHRALPGSKLRSPRPSI
jgi:hypothetical protein